MSCDGYFVVGECMGGGGSELVMVEGEIVGYVVIG